MTVNDETVPLAITFVALFWNGNTLICGLVDGEIIALNTK